MLRLKILMLNLSIHSNRRKKISNLYTKCRMIPKIKSKDYIDWLEKSIADEHIKYYKYLNFQNIKQVGEGERGRVYRAVLLGTIVFLL